jgi:MFS family permease
MLLPEMLPALAISKTEAGVIFSSYFIAYTVLSPVLGLLADRYNVRVILALFSVILGAGAFLMAYSSSLVEASLFFTLAAIGHSACWVPVVTLAQRWVGERRRGMALAFIDLGSSFGIVVSSAVIPLIVAAYSWRMGWMSLGALAFLVAVINFLLVRSYPAGKSAPSSPGAGQHTSEPVGVTYLKLLRNSRFWLMGLSYLLIGFSILIPFTFLSTYAVQELALSYDIAVRLITVIGIAAVVGKLALGPFSDTVGRIRIMMLCAVLIAIGSFGMAYNRGLLTLILFTVVFGIGYGAVWALYAAAARDYFSKESTGSIVGLWTLLCGVGSIFSPILAGWMADTTGTLAWSFILAMGGAVIALLLLVPVWVALRPATPTGKGLA